MIDILWPIVSTALACIATCGWYWCSREVRRQDAARRYWREHALVAGNELRFIHVQRHLAAKKGRAAQIEQQRALVAETTARLRASAK